MPFVSLPTSILGKGSSMDLPYGLLPILGKGSSRSISAGLPPIIDYGSSMANPVRSPSTIPITQSSLAHPATVHPFPTVEDEAQ